MGRKALKSVIQAGICIGSCLFFLFVSFNALAQTETEWALVLNGSVISQNDKTKLVGAKVVVYKNGARSDQSMTDAKGKFSLRLPPDAKYMLEFSYVGYSTKRISFNTKMVPPEASAGGDFLFPFDMTLFKEMEGLDVSILSKPLAEVAFDPNLQDFSYNKEYTKSVQAQIEKLQSDLEAKLLAESEALKEVEKQYQKSMADGAKAMAAGDYMGAKTAYAAALAVKAGPTWMRVWAPAGVGVGFGPSSPPSLPQAARKSPSPRFRTGASNFRRTIITITPGSVTGRR